LQAAEQEKEKVVEPAKEQERVAKTVRQNKGGRRTCQAK
jgi:hypothetical protein